MKEIISREIVKKGIAKRLGIENGEIDDFIVEAIYLIENIKDELKRNRLIEEVRLKLKSYNNQ